MSLVEMVEFVAYTDTEPASEDSCFPSTDSASQAVMSNSRLESPSPTGSESPNSSIRESLSPSPVKLYKQSDFQGLTYREMVSEVEPLMEVIYSNPLLQSSLQSILVNTATANNGMRDIIDSVSHSLYTAAYCQQRVYCTCMEYNFGKPSF
ncbi:PREDICTED: uncharacterized protein LOC109584055 [Amphimedon queenslandica]|uniref:Uncharacterized protein n=1 Tax=Amphimedon queenslandica TaxID=400682 RepID=A0AAN0JER7_AMPQE|nr:PREDICTED: uncharacterized protein LOC109584055 [Amphimedon queenslandica]|eukprot:XP_019855173.1 PREDICTED: uncharacterized protein LOC109584055 [Amphimedon queenslandica]